MPMSMPIEDIKQVMRRQAKAMRAPRHLRERIMMIPHHSNTRQKFWTLSWNMPSWNIPMPVPALAASFVIGAFAFTAFFLSDLEKFNQKFNESAVIVFQYAETPEEDLLDPSGIFTTSFYPEE